MVDLRGSGERFRQIALLGSIPMVLVAGPLIGFLIGSFLDRSTGFAPWLTVIFILLGVAAAIRQTVRLLVKAEEEDQKDGKGPH